MMPAPIVQPRKDAAEPVPASAGSVGRNDSRSDSRGDALLLALNALPPGDPARAAARASAIEWYLPLAGHLARRYAGRGEPLGDLSQVATIGLIKAIDRYDASRNVPFASYATPTILGEIKRYFRDVTWTIRVPRRLQEARVELAKATEELRSRLGRTPTTRELSELMCLTEEEVIEARKASNGYTSSSLDAALSSDAGAEGETVLADVIGSDDPGLELVDDLSSLAPLIAQLDERERKIIHMRYVEERTQAEIGEELGISQMHVSRLISRMLRRLRAGLLDPAVA